MGRALLILLVLVIPLAARATSFRTPDGIAVSNIAVIFEAYQKDYGHLPKNWSELEHYFGSPIDDSLPYIKPTQRYAFLDPPLELPSSYGHQGRVLLIGRSPFHEVTKIHIWYGPFGPYNRMSGPARWMLVEDTAGHYEAILESEDRIQALFLAAHRPLPTPDTVGLHPQELVYQHQLHQQMAIAVIIVVTALATLVFFFRRRRA